MQKIYVLALVSMISFGAFSQGSIGGTVKDVKTGEAIIGANVVIQGTTIGSATDVEGNFLINNVKEGTYSIVVSYVTYKTNTIPDVVVGTAKRVTLDIPLAEDVAELSEVVVTAARRTDTDFDLLKSVREAKVVVVGITAEQISKSLDRDAAQVLRRVPGVTIRGDQFVQVRGLSERYNPVMLHNVYAPSVETDIRSFSFQTLPSSQLDKMLVFKSPAADLPGDFAGGVVKVFTKSIPDENSIVLDYSTQVRAGTTFQDYYHQQKDASQLTGFNTGYYDLPADFPSTLTGQSDASLVQASNSLKNLWTEQKGTAIPDQRFGVTVSRVFNAGNVKIGNISALTYSNTFSSFDIKRGDFNTTGGVASGINSFNDQQYNQQIRAGFLFNWAFKFKSGSTIEFKNLYNQSSNDQFVSRLGVEGSSIKGGGFDKVYRGIYSGQLMGTHQLFKNKTSLEWVAGYNKSTRDQPDYKRYRYSTSTGSPDQLIISNVANPIYLGRFFSKLNESSYTVGLSVKQQLGLFSDPLKNPELKFGFFYENKDRTFSARNIGYINGTDFLVTQQVQSLPIGQVFDPANNPKGIKIGEDTKRKDAYSASNSLLAYYLMASIPFTQKLKLDAGVRIEDNTQKLDSYDDLAGISVNVNNPVTRALPSANLSYNFTEKMLVRGAYGQTLNRPEFRELAPFSFYDYNLNFVFSGNKNLRTAQIQNIDLRWEFYPSKGELITAGAFYKYFTDPIETIADPNFGGVREARFNNPANATAYGFEIEVKKSLNNLTSSKILSRINLLFNATFIHSQITLRPDQASGQRADRPLQGQAPYVFNTGIFYSNEETGWQLNLLHNVVGKNIFVVGNDNYADVYLMPRHVVDLTFNKSLGQRFQIKGGISDILNQPIQLLQDGDNGNVKFSGANDGKIQDYKPGQVFSLGLSVRL